MGKLNSFLGCNALQFGKNPPMFQRNVLPPSSVSKNESSKKPAVACCLLIAGFLLGSVDFFHTTCQNNPEVTNVRTSNPICKTQCLLAPQIITS
jgi:hypothetical protein